MLSSWRVSICYFVLPLLDPKAEGQPKAGLAKPDAAKPHTRGREEGFAAAKSTFYMMPPQTPLNSPLSEGRKTHLACAVAVEARTVCALVPYGRVTVGFCCFSSKKGQALPVLFCLCEPAKSRFLLFDVFYSGK
jgi:hypothetical protein